MKSIFSRRDYLKYTQRKEWPTFKDFRGDIGGGWASMAKTAAIVWIHSRVAFN